jgi:hypothetical protein
MKNFKKSIAGIFSEYQIIRISGDQGARDHGIR